MDASALVDALVLPPGADSLHDRLSREQLHAPTLLDHEVVSALRRLSAAASLSPRGPRTP